MSKFKPRIKVLRPASGIDDPHCWQCVFDGAFWKYHQRCWVFGRGWFGAARNAYRAMRAEEAQQVAARLIK